MTLPLVFHPDVNDEVDDARRWYNRQRKGLGADFVRALKDALQQLSAMPLVNRVLSRNVRRALLRRFPYGVYYRVYPDRVQVIAVQHLHRDSGGWQSRA
ncbi:MAG TPA: type II toxin-antitoxin system RelE/ParE family toxin [Gemmataceae bacterium]|nr:type II toxin-antitoxin system RelE/ParE family toxin [Gemmataceae bacterium]